MSDPRTRQAFALWTQAQPAVSAFVYALAGDARVRDEVLQEVAVALLESFDTYDESRPFLPWVLAIARNKVADARRRRARSPVPLTEAAVDSLASALSEVEETERERLALLEDCLARVRGQPRDICELRYRGGASVARIAGLLGLQPNTVAKSLQRVRDELRACIEERLSSQRGRA
ncbi:MAG: polymerase sigma factor CnrH [Planctomycetota bacterium]|jgi:RNA polymerase sigma-70 factor (ECF subfamily)